MAIERCRKPFGPTIAPCYCSRRVGHEGACGWGEAAREATPPAPTIAEKLKAEADAEYVQYVDEAAHKELLLGAEAKLKTGTFTHDHLRAHRDHAIRYGKHVALMKAVALLSTAASLDEEGK